MGLRLKWDAEKAAANLRKHGVSFEEATTVFGDPLSLTISDPDHSENEARFLDLGLSHRGRLLIVSYTERGDRFELSVPGLPVGWKEKPMKQRKTKPRQADEPLRPEYDFSQSVRGKHAARYAAGTNVVVLEPDVASAFPSAEEVNEALRALAQIMRRRASSRKRTSKIA